MVVGLVCGVVCRACLARMSASGWVCWRRARCSWSVVVVGFAEVVRRGSVAEVRKDSLFGLLGLERGFLVCVGLFRSVSWIPESHSRKFLFCENVIFSQIVRDAKGERGKSFASVSRGHTTTTNAWPLSLSLGPPLSLLVS